jgi:hypothetical protein
VASKGDVKVSKVEKENNNPPKGKYQNKNKHAGYKKVVLYTISVTSYTCLKHRLNEFGS